MPELPPPSSRLPLLPPLVQEKLNKTGTTRGAATREIYQNRVARNNPVLIDWEVWESCKTPDDDKSAEYENGFIVLIKPSWFFATEKALEQLEAEDIKLGRNALLLFQRRQEWEAYGPAVNAAVGDLAMVPATSRQDPLGGVYMARVHATTSSTGQAVVEGYSSREMRGAGIRVYEYASSYTIAATKLQLECLLWLCRNSEAQLTGAGMDADGAKRRRQSQCARADAAGLLDRARLKQLRMLNESGHTVCPLCLRELSAADFLRRTEQATGRETHDLTTTEMSLFHIEELRVGKLQHKTYNLGWGHHHCNVVVKDAGISKTLQWMKGVLDNQVSDSVEDSVEEVAALVEEAVRQ